MFSRTNSSRNFSRFGGNSGRGARRGPPVSNIDVTKYTYRVVPNDDALEPNSAMNSGVTFEDLKINKSILRNLTQVGFVNATPIQAQGIPYVMEGKDVIGLANTGTGKTGAFLIPLVEKALNDKNQKILIVVPNRELAFQINQELFTFSKGLNVFSTLCIGGADISRQISFLRKQNHFVIGTPGRLTDLYDRKVLKLEEFSTVVLDEVDTMLDMGFIGDLTFLIEKLATPRQSLFFSATMQPKINDIAKGFLTDPVTVSIKTEGAGKNVQQDMIVYNDKEEKLEKFYDLLEKEKVEKTLVFVATKMMADKLEGLLLNKNYKVAAIHGDKRQNQRFKSLDAFKRGAVDILVATDVASRGIDIKDVTHVINFDEPESFVEYTHRIGRTGRYGKPGSAFTFVPIERTRGGRPSNSSGGSYTRDRSSGGGRSFLSGGSSGSSRYGNSRGNSQGRESRYGNSRGGGEFSRGGYSGGLSPIGGTSTTGRSGYNRPASAGRGGERSSYGRSSGGRSGTSYPSRDRGNNGYRQSGNAQRSSGSRGNGGA